MGTTTIMPPSLGYWGKTSATIDWCEENYVVTHYIAEFWNTISNVMMIVPPLLAAILAMWQKLEHRMIMSYLSLMVVGVGSWFFHMTLLYSMQLLDELPMLWGSMFLLYSIIEAEKPLYSTNRPLQVGLLVFCTLVTLVYLIDKTPVFFQLAYAAMVAVMVYKSWRLVVLYSSKLKVHLILVGLSSYLLGVIVWMIDNLYCSHIRKLRSYSPVGAVGAVTQLHAWWHILAGLGTYLYIVFCTAAALGDRPTRREVFSRMTKQLMKNTSNTMLNFHSRYVLLKQDPLIRFWKGVWPYIDVQKPLKTI